MRIKKNGWLISVMVFSGFLASTHALAGNEIAGKSAVAIFAGGCFWCMEPPFDALPGVSGTVSGYTGGHVENPTYKEVSNGKTGHSEALQVTYDPSKISYEQLLEVFWHNIDPFNDKGQFCDDGEQYKAIIFYEDESQKQLAEASKQLMSEKFHGKLIATAIKSAKTFFPAEEYHQNYYQNNPKTYKFYRFTCGRDFRLRAVWGQ